MLGLRGYRKVKEERSVENIWANEFAASWPVQYSKIHWFYTFQSHGSFRNLYCAMYEQMKGRCAVVCLFQINVNKFWVMAPARQRWTEGCTEVNEFLHNCAWVPWIPFYSCWMCNAVPTHAFFSPNIQFSCWASVKPPPSNTESWSHSHLKTVIGNRLLLCQCEHWKWKWCTCVVQGGN